jgi:hypothetical protein
VLPFSSNLLSFSVLSKKLKINTYINGGCEILLETYTLNIVLKRIYGPHKFINFAPLNIIRVGKEDKMGRAGRTHDENAKSIHTLGWKAEGMRPFVRPRHRLKNINNKINLMEMCFQSVD